jgi:hypothetical protein
MSSVSRVTIPFALASSLLGAAMVTSARAEEAAASNGTSASASATAANPAATKSSERALRERVKGFWDARLAHSEKAYDFYLPPAKGGLPRSSVADGTNVVWQNYEIAGVKITGDRAWVTIQGRVSLLLPKPMPIPDEALQRVVPEEWRRTDGVWYRQPIEAGLSKAVGEDSHTGRFPPQPEGGDAAKTGEGAKK